MKLSIWIEKQNGIKLRGISQQTAEQQQYQE